jgi:hypothetical protein
MSAFNRPSGTTKDVCGGAGRANHLHLDQGHWTLEQDLGHFRCWSWGQINDSENLGDNVRWLMWCALSYVVFAFLFYFDDDIDLRAPLGWLAEECSHSLNSPSMQALLLLAVNSG